MKKAVMFSTAAALVSIFLSPSAVVAQQQRRPVMPSAAGIESREADGRFRDLQISEKITRAGGVKLAITIVEIPDSVKKLLRPADEDLTRHAEFLKQENTGIARIYADPGCLDAMTVAADKPECKTALQIEGGGSYFSFRRGKHIQRVFSDLHFIGGEFHADGLMTAGLFSYLGKTPLDRVSLEDETAKKLFAVNPDGWNELKNDKEFAKKVSANSIKAVSGTGATYLLRSIAFRGGSPLAGVNQYGQPLNPLLTDKRVDVLIAFQIVRRDEKNNSIIILWKELARQKSPKI